MRLLREERLDTPDERERALSRAMDALGRIARLCDDASAFLASPNPSATTTISAAFLAASVEARVREFDFAVTRGPIDPAARVRLGTSAERLAEAIASVADAVRHRVGAKDPRLHIDSGTDGVRFSAVAQALIGRLESGSAPQLILLDVMMPDLDGIETLRAIRQAQPSAQVIMLSGRQTPATIVEAVRLGAADYVLKPGDPDGVGEAALESA